MANETLSTELITTFNEDVISKIASLEQLFPSKTRYDEDTINKFLKNDGWIHMFLKRDENVIGYIFALPHNYVVDELRIDDPDMKMDQYRYYLDQVAMIPEERKGYAFLQLVYDLLDELDKRGISKISSHILATNGLNKLIVRIFGSMMTEVRNVNLPVYGNDPFTYIEGTYIKK